MLHNDILEKSIFAQMMAKKKNWKKISGIVKLAELPALGQERTTTIFIYIQQYG